MDKLLILEIDKLKNEILKRKNTVKYFSVDTIKFALCLTNRFH